MDNNKNNSSNNTRSLHKINKAINKEEERENNTRTKKYAKVEEWAKSRLLCHFNFALFSMFSLHVLFKEFIDLALVHTHTHTRAYTYLYISPWVLWSLSLAEAIDRFENCNLLCFKNVLPGTIVCPLYRLNTWLHMWICRVSGRNFCLMDGIISKTKFERFVNYDRNIT